MAQRRRYGRARRLQCRQMGNVAYADSEFHQMQHGSVRSPIRRLQTMRADLASVPCGIARTTLTPGGRLANSVHMHVLARRSLFLPLVLAACGSWERADHPRRPIEPLRYDHLTKLRLNVAVVDVEDRFVAGGVGDVTARAPIAPAGALRQMAQDRLQAMGGTGRAVLIIKRASLTEVRSGYEGIMDVELDVFGQDGSRAAYAEARVSRRQSSDGPVRDTLYDMTRQMMDAMNVELEFQARRNLRDWLLGADAPAVPGDAVPVPVERQELAPPRN